VKRSQIAQLRPLERKALLEELAAMVLAGEIHLGDAARILRSTVLKMDRQTFARVVKLSVGAISQLEDAPDANPTLDTVNKVFAPFGGKLGLTFPGMEPPPALDEQRRSTREASLAALAKSRRRRRRPE
jgi:hypothetical protein